MEVNSNHCLNCGHELEDHDQFCPSCGQKTNAHVLSLGELLSNFWNSLTNLDGSAFNTLKYIWAPWKLTEFYVKGKRISYLNPMRVFLVAIVFHFGILISSFDLSSGQITKELYTQYEKNVLFTNYMEIKQKIDTIHYKNLLTQLDSTLFKDGLLIEIDTVTNFNFNGTDFHFTSRDIVELSTDSIYKKYGYDNYIDKLIAKQLIRSHKDSDNTIRYVLGNLVWAILLTILILAGFFKLLYRRRKSLYVEHLIFLMNVHSCAFLANTLVIFLSGKLISQENNNTEIDLGVSFFIVPTIIFCISLYKYYGQSVIKTSIKAIIIASIYLIINLFFIILTGFVSFLLF